MTTSESRRAAVSGFLQWACPNGWISFQCFGKRKRASAVNHDPILPHSGLLLVTIHEAQCALPHRAEE
jgi:hypothetical protein